MHSTTYYHHSAYIVGLLLGHILSKKGQPQGKYEVIWQAYASKVIPKLAIFQPWSIKAAWILAVAAYMVIIYLPMVVGNHLSQLSNSIYVATYRTVWSLLVAWVIYACERGHAGMAGILVQNEEGPKFAFFHANLAKLAIKL